MKLFPDVTGSSLFIVSMILFTLHVPKIEMPVFLSFTKQTCLVVFPQAALPQGKQYSVLCLPYSIHGFYSQAVGGSLKHSYVSAHIY